MTAPFLPAVEINPGTKARASVIWLHGLGADGHDFEPIVPHLRLSNALSVRFVFPHAPERPVTVNGGYVMRAWYDIIEQSIDRQVDLSGIQASAELIEDLVARELDNGISASDIILAGFSQGGVIALDVGLRHQPKLGGIIALSTYLADPDRVISGDLPIFMGHGSLDPLVPINLGESARNVLQKKGYSVKWHTYPIEHSVCMQEITEIGDWLRERLTDTHDS